MTAVPPGGPEHRARIIANMRRQRDELLQYFADVAHWNRYRRTDEDRIDPDPDGILRPLLEGLEFSLAAEAAAPGLGRIEPIAGVPGAKPDEREPQ